MCIDMRVTTTVDGTQISYASEAWYGVYWKIWYFGLYDNFHDSRIDKTRIW